MRLRTKLAVTAGVAATVLSAATPAFADNCFNISRPINTNTPTQTGNWSQLATPLGTIWAFEPPENYQNGTPTHWLLSNTPYCQQGGYLLYNGPRTTTNGVQSGCGLF